MEEIGCHQMSSSEAESSSSVNRWDAFAARHDFMDWEGRFHPCDDETCGLVLNGLHEEDTVLDIGAGDLRLSMQMSSRVKRVYAVEVNPLLVAEALGVLGLGLPRNLHVVCANALDVVIPRDVTVAVLLMRHCQHFGAYFTRLQEAGCLRLVTNARWKSGVEAIDLTASRMPFDALREGWYACGCGAVGYVGRGDCPQGDASEVCGCPSCQT